MSDYSISNENSSSLDNNSENTETFGNVINVDNDFGGNLEQAIASANHGNTIELGSNTYYTDGITVDKDLTIDGNGDSVINGGGTSNTIMTLTQEASGATIKDLKITNGNNGIFGNGATNLTLENLEVSDIGLNQVIRSGENNTGIILHRADGLKLLNSNIHNVGRKGVGVGATDGAEISGLTVHDINLEAQHAQSHDAAGVKFYNTNNAAIRNSNFSDINAFNIWNDTTSNTTIEGNTISNVGEDFLAPDFNNNVDISGIYDEKTSNSTVKNNSGTSVDRFLVFDATEFSTETINFSDNNFSDYELGSQDYWFNEQAEKTIATTENPLDASFNSVASEYYGQANIG